MRTKIEKALLLCGLIALLSGCGNIRNAGVVQTADEEAASLSGALGSSMPITLSANSIVVEGEYDCPASSDPQLTWVQGENPYGIGDSTGEYRVCKSRTSAGKIKLHGQSHAAVLYIYPVVYGASGSRYVPRNSFGQFVGAARSTSAPVEVDFGSLTFQGLIVMEDAIRVGGSTIATNTNFLKFLTGQQSSPPPFSVGSIPNFQ